MYQHIDLMVAKRLAREREHDLQVALRQRQAFAHRAPAVAGPEPAVGHHWLRNLLVRVHLAHATQR